VRCCVLSLEGGSAITWPDPLSSPAYVINGGDIFLLIEVMNVHFLFRYVL
jgi:hypothetical protein